VSVTILPQGGTAASRWITDDVSCSTRSGSSGRARSRPPSRSTAVLTERGRRTTGGPTAVRRPWVPSR
jgi:hypothetical protein